MKDKKSNESRRKLLKSIAAGSGAVIAGKSLPESWSRPVVDSVILPAHAQATCTDRPITGMRTSLDLLISGNVAAFSINNYLGGNQTFTGSWSGTTTRTVTINDTRTINGCTVTVTVNATVNVPGTTTSSIESLSWTVQSTCPDGNVCSASGSVFFTIDISGDGDIYFNVCVEGTECCTLSGLLPVNDQECILPSDRNIKENFSDVDEQEILRKLACLPIETWNYNDREEGVRHIGPMAQDFQAQFNVGGSDKHINMVDANGVNMAAIKALNVKLEVKDAQIQALQEQLDKVMKRLDKLV